jgi:hypothetical protein
VAIARVTASTATVAAIAAKKQKTRKTESKWPGPYAKSGSGVGREENMAAAWIKLEKFCH